VPETFYPTDLVPLIALIPIGFVLRLMWRVRRQEKRRGKRTLPKYAMRFILLLAVLALANVITGVLTPSSMMWLPLGISLLALPLGFGYLAWVLWAYRDKLSPPRHAQPWFRLPAVRSAAGSGRRARPATRSPRTDGPAPTTDPDLPSVPDPERPADPAAPS
jgi:hypothetical protein